MDTKWVKESFDKGKIEILKFAKASKIKIDITSLNKKKDERIKVLGNKVLEMVENGELDTELFEPDYTYIKNINSEIAEKEAELEFADDAEDEAEEINDDLDIVQIESQKVLTADSIPMETEIKDENKDEVEQK